MNRTLEGLSLLVVDDEADILEIFREEFELVGAKITHASCGSGAYDLILQQKFDLVITDANMANGNGLDLLKAIRFMDPKFPQVVFVTGHSEFNHAQAYAQGASAIFSKPTHFPDLILALSRLVAPVGQRWSRKSERIAAQAFVVLKARDMNTALAAQVLNIGQGGMFVHLANEFLTVGALIDFDIQFDGGEQLVSLEGTGVVRWVRTQDSEAGKSGCGVEFMELEDIPQFEKFLTELKSTPFIPMR